LGNNALAGQPFGYVGNMMLYNKKLTQNQIKQNYDALKNVYRNGDFIINNLRLYFNPSNNLSYPGSGTTINDITGNSLNGTLSNITYTDTYFSFNGTSSQVTVADNAVLEPGSGDWTMEAWFNVSNTTGSKVILGKFDAGGGGEDVSYSIRIGNANLFAQVGNGTPSGFVNSGNYVITANVWYQVVYVWNNVATNSFTTYINGVQVLTTSHSLVSLLNSTNPLYLGSYNNGEFSQWFNGKMGIVRIYNSALSASDVSKNFEANRNIYGI
jgi:Concanavalin A-like lectin/glucanases superfamily